MIENRIATWVSIVVGVVAITPVVRSLYQEYRDYRERTAPKDADVIPLPPAWTRDLYDSTR